MTTSPRQLAEHVFFCLCGNRIVFLDLRQNQYLCLNQRNTQTAISLFTSPFGPDTKPLSERRATDSTSDSEDTRLVVRALTDKGILAQDGTNGKEATSVRIQTPENVLLPEGSRLKPSIRPSHWVAFLHASLKASWKLRWYSMQQTVRSVENRKQRRVKSPTADHNVLRELVAIFHHLRPYYARAYRCLYDSLALIEFLAHYRVFPHWVFGVTAEPFSAHCWVQENDCVLNDAVDYIGGFTPIMAV